MPRDIAPEKLKTAAEAVGPIRSGMRVLVGSGASEPQRLVEALSARAEDLADAEVVHLMTLGTAPYAQPRFAGRLRHNALFIGANVREAVHKGLADYTPCHLSEIPGLIRSGRIAVDAALISIAPPAAGACSLGLSVDILQAAVEAADYVVAQVNPRMPWTLGDSCISPGAVDAFVVAEEPLVELPAAESTAAALWIGRYVARLVEDGSTVQTGIGAIPDAVLAGLEGKRDLGIHSEMISDGVLRLHQKGVITGKRKAIDPGRIVTSFCMGSSELYAAVNRNPVFQFHPSDYANNPLVIARHDRFVAINSALQVDLTGQVAADSIGKRFHSGVGGQADFIRGAAASRGGRSIIALPSTAKQGTLSRIVAVLNEAAGVVTTRADVDFVVTEYGIASLKGKTIRERAVALISIAHPRHRDELTAAAKGMGFLDAGHVLPQSEEPYREDLETRRIFSGRELFFRALKPSDERRLKEMFYSQSWETTLHRFGIPLKRLSERQFQELVAIDYGSSMAVAGFVHEGARERMVAVARYYAEPGESLAEAAFTVHDDYQGLGIGTFLVDYLSWIASERGLEGFKAEIAGFNPRMRRALLRCYRTVSERSIGPDGNSVIARFRDRKRQGNPAGLEAPAAAREARS